MGPELRVAMSLGYRQGPVHHGIVLGKAENSHAAFSSPLFRGLSLCLQTWQPSWSARPGYKASFQLTALAHSPHPSRSGLDTNVHKDWKITMVSQPWPPGHFPPFQPQPSCVCLPVCTQRHPPLSSCMYLPSTDPLIVDAAAC